MKNHMEYYSKIKVLSRKKFIKEVIQWAIKADPCEIYKWNAIARVYLRNNGWNKAAIKDFFNIGESDTFRSVLNSDIAQFYEDVFYCSDRMSIDRIFRCQIQYINASKLLNPCPDKGNNRNV